MTDPGCTNEELLAYIDEMLTPERASEIETLLRDHPGLRERVAQLARERDMGVHSVGEIWRRARLSCPDRAVLGRHLLQTLEPDEANYIDFHIFQIGCRICRANLDDLKKASQVAEEPVQKRRRKYFESSAGHLRRHD